MKIRIIPITAYLFSAFVLCLFTSCGDLQHNIYLKADGSGTMETTFDLGEFMSMMGELGSLSPDTDTVTDDLVPDTATLAPAQPKDAITLLIEKITDPAHALDVDTTMSLISIMPDSVRQKETRLDIAEKIGVRLVSPANSPNLTIGIKMDFENKVQLQEMIDYFLSIDQGSGVLGSSSPMNMDSETFLKFDMDMQAGWIKIDTMLYSAVVTSFGMSQDSSASSEDMGMMEMMFGNSKIKSVIHVPGEVVSCTNPDALLTKDNRVIVEYPFMDAIKNGSLPGYTIYFKPQK